MSIRCIQTVINGPQSLTGSRLLVMLALAEWSNDDGLSWHCIAEIARRARLKERATQYVLQHLAEDGYLAIEQGQGRTHTSRYTILVDALIKGAKGASIVAPFNKEEKVQNDAEKVQSHDIKGAKSDIKGATAVAPEPLRTVINRKRTVRESARPSSFPNEFTITPEMRDKAKAEGWTDWIDVDKHTARFIEYWTIGDGAGVKKKNWKFTWMTWLRREVDNAQSKGLRVGGSNGSTQGQVSADQHGPRAFAFPKIARPPRKVG